MSFPCLFLYSLLTFTFLLLVLFCSLLSYFKSASLSEVLVFFEFVCCLACVLALSPLSLWFTSFLSYFGDRPVRWIYCRLCVCVSCETCLFLFGFYFYSREFFTVSLRFLYGFFVVSLSACKFVLSCEVLVLWKVCFQNRGFVRSFGLLLLEASLRLLSGFCSRYCLLDSIFNIWSQQSLLWYFLRLWIGFCVNAGYSQKKRVLATKLARKSPLST